MDTLLTRVGPCVFTPECTSRSSPTQSAYTHTAVSIERDADTGTVPTRVCGLRVAVNTDTGATLAGVVWNRDLVPAEDYRSEAPTQIRGIYLTIVG